MLSELPFLVFLPGFNVIPEEIEVSIEIFEKETEQKVNMVCVVPVEYVLYGRENGYHERFVPVLIDFLGVKVGPWKDLNTALEEVSLGEFFLESLNDYYNVYVRT